ncbi:MAG: DNA gyrase inhibitor YacG [Acidobacteriota bacterium]
MPKCPTCGKTVERQDNSSRPFCSERCQLIDFGRWTDEEYRVPGRRINPAEMAEPPEADRTSTDDDKDVEH